MATTLKCQPKLNVLQNLAFQFQNDRCEHHPLPMKNSRNKLEVQIKIPISLTRRADLY
ncbi:hypothetical protein DPMN_084433 [Dreissena polymorpha]|uniref:Uncharacterized protein n=1 Tax=Dreissena polymorpha TaxID=45954 RepID=A0A9D4BC08_DREPO|nr:hypothetical protein DPMN_084433 [Dreissena polymorpha]